MVVRAGEWDLLSSDEIVKSVDQNVKTIIMHDNYDDKTAANDISLLILQKPFKLTSTINLICLPPQAFNFDGNKCLVTGWGN